MKSVVILLISLVFSFDASAYEKLTYNLKVMGADFGTATVYVNGNKVLAGMKSNDKWASVYSVDNKIASVVGAAGTPKRTEYTYNVAGKSGHRDITFERRKIKVDGKRKRTFKTMGKPIHDPITWMMRVRRQLARGVGVGELTFKVFSGAKFYNVSCKPLPQQVVQTALGQKLAQPYVVRVTRLNAWNNYQREMTMWFNLESKTESFEPLKVVGKFKLGQAEANLVTIETKGEQR